MSKELTTKTAHSGLSEADIKTLATAGVIPFDTPSAVVSVFATACKEHGLSPFKKEIYLVKYQTAKGAIYANIVGIDGLRVKAARTGRFAGRDDAKYDVQADGSFKTAAQIKTAKQMPVTCTITIYSVIGGLRCPFTKTVVFAEYYPAVANPSPDRKDFSKAATMPFNMIEKCAEAAALRMGFADETAGLHIEEEAAAYQEVTIQAAEKRPEIAVDAEALKDRLANVWTLPVLREIYDENEAHKDFADLFNDRRDELKTLIANGQISKQ